MIEECPNCKATTDSKKWDGWDCNGCGYALPQKARKAYGKLVRKGDPDDDDEDGGPDGD